MLFGESGALLRPLSRRLAAVGWGFAGAALVCGLAVAVASGVRLTSTMQAVQGLGLAGTAASALFLLLAICAQPGRAQLPAATVSPCTVSPGTRTTEQQRSFLLAAVVMLAAVVGFAAAGWASSTGPSPQSIAFSQVFLLGAVDCGLSFLLLNKVRPQQDR
jgi:hypothetical protein